MKLVQFIILLLLISACTAGVKMKHVNLGSLFHDENSKVWMLDKVLVGNKDFAPKDRREKDIIIFYEDGKCCFQPLISLGGMPGKMGEYSIFSNDRTLTIYFKNEKWDFKITKMEEDKIVLKPTSNSDLKYTLVLIPLPQLY